MRKRTTMIRGSHGLCRPLLRWSTGRNCLLYALALLLGRCGVCLADEAATLRLVPFPKQLELRQGTFSLQTPLILEAPRDAADLLGRLIAAEMQRAGLPEPKIQGVDRTGSWRLSARSGGAAPEFAHRKDATPEDYVMAVGGDAVVCDAPGRPGLFYGVQTLCQLLRANCHDKGLRQMTIRDWPSLRWRCFQDDLTRGPSSTLPTLRQHIDLGAELKMNLFTYYMEYQYAFKKHPQIGPNNGSLTPEDLQTLVAYAKSRSTEVLGNQQSFGHLTRVLQHPQYAELRETAYLITPVKEESYQLLDDLYSEVCPILPFEMFNVCCDETWGLGTGPSKALAEKIGTGGVYVQHIRRVHDLLKDKHKKRMMMWGDIILQHPDKLEQIPKDTVMLTWGYGARESFEHQILPFTGSGYEFFVCPGISNWSRILPDFGVATTNIRNFVRDGAKHGTLGMLNTAWEDDGEAIQGYKWHGYAWGAECAWNASATTPEEFHRRIGAVLFGESGDHFGRAIELLAQTHRLPGMQGMNNKRFWQNDFLPRRNPLAIRASAARLLEVVRPAIEHLEACRQEATVNGDLLDYFLFGARRMELIGQRMLDGLQAAQSYTRAYEAADKQQSVELLVEVERLVRANRDAHQALGQEFQRLWLAESKPYALDWTMKRYQDVVKWYDDLAAKLADGRKRVEAGESLPRPESIGLALPQSFARRTRPHKTTTVALKPEAPWAEPSASHRLGLVVRARSVDRFELPVEVDVPLPADLATKPVRAFCTTGDRAEREILAQLDPSDQPARTRLNLLVPGPIAKGSEASIHVYLGLPESPKPLPQAVSTRDASTGMKWIENDKVRLLLAPEGGHVYRWEVKGLEGRDLTMPGETGWNGFSDLAGGHRHTTHTLSCTADGPAVVRYKCVDPAGLAKTVSLYGGTSWVEVVLDEPVGHYWDFDDPKSFAADGPTPGTYLFSNGATGPVGKQSDGVPAQKKAEGVRWAIKSNRQQLALGLTTPETAAHFRVAPGAGAGGVGIEQSPLASHFVTYAGLLEEEPAQTMNRLQQTLDFKNQPEVILQAIQGRE